MCRPLTTRTTRRVRCAFRHRRMTQTTPIGQADDELPFEERERQRQFGGARRPAPPPTKPLPKPTAAPAVEKEQQPLLPKRANKNRPIEQSSKKAVPRFRDVLQAGNKGPADPRFARDAEEPGDHSSTKELWRKRYAFVFDELLPKEKEEAQRAMSVRVFFLNYCYAFHCLRHRRQRASTPSRHCSRSSGQCRGRCRQSVTVESATNGRTSCGCVLCTVLCIVCCCCISRCISLWQCV